ncbi:hypothetical protein [Flavobacterium sp. KACC 22761]|uniref:hypothetical protein n=1 Tax=Flavobacterium sp. KACC 22761 TaxID=3092665 RepID=UPI002A75F222|nr:hypothetical protein [Flavobacterium sp. KACC 22761]WPO79369.1 hypothetical protein SCB73_03085 [Flavobacterium sp. KACC 22761]
MEKKIHIMMLFIILSFFWNPSYTYACHSGHSKEIVAKEENSCSKKCCEKKTSKQEKHNCDGKCRHSSCTTSALQFVILNSNDFDLQNDVFNFSLKNTISSYSNSTISSGFTSIWLKPKI